MTPAGMLELAPVEQVDRDAAAAYLRGNPLVHRTDSYVAGRYEMGAMDDAPLVQFAARCRIAGQAELVEALKPFAEACGLADERMLERYGEARLPNDTTVVLALNITLKHLRDARAALRSSIVSNRGGDNG